MSRIGKLPVEIPAGVTITVGDKEITVAGPKGTLMVPVQQNTTTKVEENKIVVTRIDFFRMKVERPPMPGFIFRILVQVIFQDIALGLFAQRILQIKALVGFVLAPIFRVVPFCMVTAVTSGTMETA